MGRQRNVARAPCITPPQSPCLLESPQAGSEEAGRSAPAPGYGCLHVAVPDGEWAPEPWAWSQRDS